ncbi:MAG: HlyD family efflux transporter periplasmic adaptor subunit [Bacteroidota bacterium]|nr:HlyD family efflux transporter periplasmic adaptor subunit [Bacteroidota bacterium]
MKAQQLYILFVFILFGMVGCKPKEVPEEKLIIPKTPVTLTSVSNGPMSDSISFNAVSSFLKKNVVKSSALGYVEKVNVRIGDYVEQGQVLFTIKTKEASVFKSKMLDTILNFTGRFDIKANSAGIISEVDKQTDDYIADGDQLCIIAQKNSLVFLLNVPFEYNSFIHINSTCTIELPDKSLQSAVIDSRLSTVDPASQTLSYVVRPSSEKNFPENLIARVRILKSVKPRAEAVAKEAVLSDETESSFWIMQLINDSTAVRVPIVKGIETDGRVEIISPKFSSTDRILLTGNYGLGDTALVQIVKQKADE